MTFAPSPNPTDPSSAEEWLPVKQLVAAQELRGELRLNPASDFPERFTEPGPRWLQAKGSAPKEVELLEGRQLPGKSLYLVRLKGVSNRASAEALVDCTVMVPAEDRPELAEGEFHLLPYPSSTSGTVRAKSCIAQIRTPATEQRSATPRTHPLRPQYWGSTRARSSEMA